MGQVKSAIQRVVDMLTAIAQKIRSIFSDLFGLSIKRKMASGIIDIDHPELAIQLREAAMVEAGLKRQTNLIMIKKKTKLGVKIGLMAASIATLNPMTILAMGVEVAIFGTAYDAYQKISNMRYNYMSPAEIAIRSMGVSGVSIMASMGVGNMFDIPLDTLKNFYLYMPTVSNANYWNRMIRDEKKKVQSSGGLEKPSDYWLDKGLDETTMSRTLLTYEEPSRERLADSKKFNLETMLTLPGYMKDKSSKFGFADQSDEMHVKALHKRLSGANAQHVKSSDLENFAQIAMFLYGDINTHYDMTIEDAVYRALRTSGSAGQFAKRTFFESEWKNAENRDVVEEWIRMVPLIMSAIANKIELPEQYLQYMIYRKEEVLPKDENGEMKVTRVMQAPNLLLRVADVYAFGDMNDEMSNIRFKSSGQIGIDLQVELPQILNPLARWEYAETDFSNFDGSQHPYQMEACKAARLMNLDRKADPKTKKDIDLTGRYIAERYNIHIRRQVNSSWGIKGVIIGQQASGDITTSDDNTMRSSVYCAKVEMEVDKVAMLRGVKAIYCYNSGDDVIIKYDPAYVSFDVLRQVMQYVAHTFGWTMPEVIRSAYHISELPKPTFLGHNVTTVELIVGKAIYMVKAICRNEDRLYGKMIYNANQPDVLSMENRSIQTAKSLSYMSMLWSMPTIVYFNAMVLITSLRGPSETADISYSWQKASKLIKADLIDSVLRSIEDSLPTDRDIIIAAQVDNNEWIEVWTTLIENLRSYKPTNKDQETIMTISEKQVKLIEKHIKLFEESVMHVAEECKVYYSTLKLQMAIQITIADRRRFMNPHAEWGPESWIQTTNKTGSDDPEDTMTNLKDTIIKWRKATYSLKRQTCYCNKRRARLPQSEEISVQEKAMIEYIKTAVFHSDMVRSNDYICAKCLKHKEQTEMKVRRREENILII